MKEHSNIHIVLRLYLEWRKNWDIILIDKSYRKWNINDIKEKK